ncbi:predicted protein [Histoplasma mississippiense (nom. inval.)]|uniref:predicted protein n=1 Tax=Ajellomyces capsulatus (strain NAm1 / WU24) TaxID=2059318 RepID=UPI000157B74A|nr:predicted protein [Histoplasma mississippiense (nom. inval.)]EDN04097.1 predicted protein [Histoplasma mississippiense (nom. inval.)]
MPVPPPHQHQQQQQQQDDKRQAAREVVDILHEISTILNTHLDRTELSLCVSLIENGVNPEALAAVIKECAERRDCNNNDYSMLHQTPPPLRWNKEKECMNSNVVMRLTPLFFPPYLNYAILPGSSGWTCV